MSVERGKEIVREVFQQDIKALLADHRAVQITTRLSFYPLMSKDAILEWVADNIGDEPVPFPCRHCNDTGECYYGHVDGVPIASSLGPCVCVKKNPCICGTCDGSDCGQLSAAHLTGPPGCQCQEKMREAGWTHDISCDHCSAIRLKP